VTLCVIFEDENSTIQCQHHPPPPSEIQSSSLHCSRQQQPAQPERRLDPGTGRRPGTRLPALAPPLPLSGSGQRAAASARLPSLRPARQPRAQNASGEHRAGSGGAQRGAAEARRAASRQPADCRRRQHEAGGRIRRASDQPRGVELLVRWRLATPSVH
jgi:hypothetical protein